LTAHLAELITGLGYLTRRSGRRTEKASTLVKQALFNCEFRLRAHEIALTNAFAVAAGVDDFIVKCTRRLVVATIMNIVDNAIYWSDVAATPRKGRAGRSKRLYIGVSYDLGGNAIVLADNGPGFLDDPAILTQALVSRRPEGMGIGLHLADQVMRAHGGHLAFPDAGDVGVPPGHEGAVVALVFPEQAKA
jgi:nitrogen fixation/metabolism regulation signal transduction histidine kinase